MQTIRAFWTWFQENEETYYRFLQMDLEERDYHFGILDSWLSSFDPCVSAILRSPQQLQKAVLTFTAKGRPEGILYVQNLVAQAPRLPRWEFIAFIQPVIDLALCEKKQDEPYEFTGLTIKASDLYWIPSDYDPETDTWVLFIVFKGCRKSVQELGMETVLDYIYYIFQDVLGELVLTRKISNAVCDEFTLADHELAQPIHKLPGFLEEYL
jgi:hypothetical protein